MDSDVLPGSRDGRAGRDLPMQRSMTRLARNAFRISLSAIYTCATAMLSTYSAKAEFITLSDFDNTAVVTGLNNLGVPAPHIFATPLKVGIYLFTTGGDWRLVVRDY
jgi:hypothetical protein